MERNSVKERRKGENTPSSHHSRRLVSKRRTPSLVATHVQESAWKAAVTATTADRLSSMPNVNVVSVEFVAQAVEALCKHVTTTADYKKQQKNQKKNKKTNTP